MQYKCPNCDGSLEYRADMLMFGCGCCKSTFTDSEVKRMFKDCDKADLSDEQDGTDSRIDCYICSECGTEIMTSADTVPEICAYCYGKLKPSGNLPHRFIPDGIVPFQLDRDTAVSMIKAKFEKKKFIPSDFLSDKTLETVTGYYVPFWTADCQASGDLNGIARRVRSWRKGDYRFTETKEYTIERSAGISCRNVIAEDENRYSCGLIRSLEPFDHSNKEMFSSSHLSGCRAEIYNIDKGSVFPVVREKVKSVSEQLLNASVTGYSEFFVSDSRISIMNTEWNYILLPVWLMTYRYNGRIYKISMNDQNSKVSGTVPVSLKKLALLAGIVFTVLLAAVVTGMYFILENTNIIRALVCGAVAAIISAAAVCIFVLRNYRKKPEESIPERKADNETKFRVSDDSFRCQHTSKVRIE